ncbi:tetratricopeptide repeat protein [Devosia pacifica]|nr:tetratricopeptide repeat protein [Devosia pacifica]
MQPNLNLSWRALVVAGLLLPTIPAHAALTVSGGQQQPPKTDRVLVAQTQQEAQLALRIQQLEEQIRTLTGQVEGLSFQVTQMQTLLERLQEENAQLFRQMQGGGGAPPAVTEQLPAPDGQGVEIEVPNTDIPEQGVVPLPGEIEFDPRFDDGSEPLPSDQDYEQLNEDLGAVSPDEVSADPLIGTGQAGIATLGDLPVERDLQQPLDLNFTPASIDQSADASAQFNAGYEAMMSGDFAFAEDQFRQFVALYPDDERSAEAANWLGASLLEQGENQQAAEVLLDAYETQPESPRAPDLLLQLSTALAREGERDAACRTLNAIPDRFAELTDDFQTRLNQQQEEAECPPA